MTISYVLIGIAALIVLLLFMNIRIIKPIDRKLLERLEKHHRTDGAGLYHYRKK
jgi:regulator of protease activity HflC (stomatin/prohibitin superfamily)